MSCYLGSFCFFAATCSPCYGLIDIYKEFHRCRKSEIVLKKNADSKKKLKFFFILADIFEFLEISINTKCASDLVQAFHNISFFFSFHLNFPAITASTTLKSVQNTTARLLEGEIHFILQCGAY